MELLIMSEKWLVWKWPVEGSPLGVGRRPPGLCFSLWPASQPVWLGAIFLLEVGENLDPPCQSQVSLTYWCSTHCLHHSACGSGLIYLLSLRLFP